MSDHVTDRQLSQLADGELSTVARAAVLDHLASCPTCAQRHDQLTEVVASLRLEPSLEWSPARTRAVLDEARITERARDRTWPLVAVLALAGVLLGALSFSLIEAGARVGLRLASTLAAVVSHQIGVPLAVAAALVALSAVMAVATLPLTRWR